MLAFLADRDKQARATLKALYAAETSCLAVRGHAAVGLWRSGKPIKKCIEAISTVSDKIAATAIRQVEPAFVGDLATLFEDESAEICV